MKWRLKMKTRRIVAFLLAVIMTATVVFQGNYDVGISMVKADTTLINMSECNIMRESSYTYTGEELGTDFYVLYHGAKLSSDCYTYKLTNNINVASSSSSNPPTITVYGVESEGYTGTMSVPFSITAASLADAEVTLTYKFPSELSSKGNYFMSYTKDAYNPPDYTLTYNGITLVEGTDYYMSNNNENTDEYELYGSAYEKVPSSSANGVGTLDFVGMGNFTSEQQSKYYLHKGNISTQVTVTLSEYNYSYDGTAKKPKVTVVDTTSGNELEENYDYTLTYSDNTDPGTAKVTVTGMDRYKSSTSVNFTIAASDVELKDISDATVSIPACTYNGSAQEPAMSVVYDGTTLTKGTDYTVTYSDNTNAGTATAVINGIGKYNGSKTKTFTINKKSLSNVTISATGATYNFNVPAEPTVKVYDNDLKKYLTITTDYTETFSNNLSAGTGVGNVTITAAKNGNYTGTATATYDIAPLDVSSSAVVKAASQDYTGSAVTTSVTVTVGSVTLTENTDYTITYSNNINPGKSAAVNVSFMGNFTGTATGYFTINSTAYNMEDATVSSISSQTYTGSQITPAVAVYYDGQLLTKNTDYTVQYGENINAGTGAGSIVITGDGTTYVGSKTITFDISKANIENCSVSGIYNGATYDYTGSEIKPTVTVLNNNAALSEGTDYTVSYSNNTNETTSAKLTIQGINNYSGTREYTFTIKKVESTTEQSSTEQPTTTEAPSTEKQTTTEVPSTEKQTTTEVPSTEKPTTTEVPSTEKPTTTEVPSTEKPTTTEVPSTEKPTTTEVPSTEKPTTTEVPSTEKQTTTEVPSTEKQTTTEVPSTEKPTITEAPSTTETPSTTQAKAPSKVASFKVKSITTSSAKLTWKKVSNADGYMVYKKDAKTGKTKLVKTVSKKTNSYTVKKLSAGTKYTYYVCAYKKSGNKKLTSAKKTCTFVTKPKIAIKVKAKTATTKSVKLSWKKSSGATGYIIYMSTSKKGKYKQVGKTTKNSIVIKKLKKNKKYYFKVKSYKKIKGQKVSYSKLTKAVQGKTKK
jgi:hypothetical protein